MPRHLQSTPFASPDARWMQWCKTKHHWTLEHWSNWQIIPFCLEVQWMTFGLPFVRRTTAAFNVQQWFNILENFRLPTLWRRFEKGSFLFHHNSWNSQNKIHKHMDKWDWYKRTLQTSADLNLIKTHSESVRAPAANHACSSNSSV